MFLKQRNVEWITPKYALSVPFIQMINDEQYRFERDMCTFLLHVDYNNLAFNIQIEYVPYE